MKTINYCKQPSTNRLVHPYSEPTISILDQKSDGTDEGDHQGDIDASKVLDSGVGTRNWSSGRCDRCRGLGRSRLDGGNSLRGRG